MKNGLYLALLAFVGCGNDDPKTVSKTPVQAVTKYEPQRFLPAAGINSGLALDTKTGLLCRTWQWEPGFGPKDISEATPVCIDLYNLDAPTAENIQAAMGHVTRGPFVPEQKPQYRYNEATGKIEPVR